MNPEWLDVLKKVQSGDLGVDEAAKRLGDLEENQAEPAVQEILPPSPYSQSSFGDAPAAEDTQPLMDVGRWKDAWMIPFWIGTGIFVLGALLMGWSYSTAARANFWFYCSWLPMLLGLLVLFLGWWSRNARWVHVRVQSADGSRVNVSVPLPLRLAGWVLRAFGPMIPAVREQKLDFLPDILDAVSQTRDPIWVDVDDEDWRSRKSLYCLKQTRDGMC